MRCGRGMSIFVSIPDCLIDYHGNHVFQHNEFIFVGPIKQFDIHKKVSLVCKVGLATPTASVAKGLVKSYHRLCN